MSVLQLILAGTSIHLDFWTLLAHSLDDCFFSGTFNSACTVYDCVCVTEKRRNKNTSLQKNALEKYVFFKPFYPASY